MTILWQVAVALIMAPAIVAVALIFFIRDLVQAKDMRTRDEDRIAQAQFSNGSNATIKLVEILEKRQCRYNEQNSNPDAVATDK